MPSISPSHGNIPMLAPSPSSSSHGNIPMLGAESAEPASRGRQPERRAASQRILASFPRIPRTLDASRKNLTIGELNKRYAERSPFQLQILDLSHNDFSRDDESLNFLDKMPDIRKVNLSHCNLGSAKQLDHFGNMSNLKFVDLRDNFLVSLPSSLFKMERGSREIKVGGNPINTLLVDAQDLIEPKSDWTLMKQGETWITSQRVGKEGSKILELKWTRAQPRWEYTEQNTTRCLLNSLGIASAPLNRQVSDIQSTGLMNDDQRVGRRRSSTIGSYGDLRPSERDSLDFRNRSIMRRPQPNVRNRAAEGPIQDIGNHYRIDTIIVTCASRENCILM